MIHVNKLSKSFGAKQAVQSVSFELKAGEVLGFLGPNGAGKSTTMKMISGHLKPTSGQVRIDGIDLALDPISGKAKLGYMPESTPSYREMTVFEYLEFIAEAHGLNDPKSKVEKVMGLANLRPVTHQLVDTLSKGFKSRLSFAAAIIHDPPILLLDEPTDGLDPNQKTEMRSLIRGLATKKAIMISTHLLDEVDKICTRIMILSQGKIVLDGTPKDLLTHGADATEAFRKLTISLE